MLQASRLEIHNALSTVPGITPVPRFPQTPMKTPTVVYTRIQGNPTSKTTKGEFMDETVGYNLEIISDTLDDSERFGDLIITALQLIGYELVMSSQNGPQSILLTFSRWRDTQTDIVFGRSI